MVTWSEETPDHGLREDTGSVHSGDYVDGSRQRCPRNGPEEKESEIKQFTFLKNKRHSIFL